jgi:hypothetical protein
MKFKGNLESDFLKLVNIDDEQKSNLINFAAQDFLTLRDSLVEYIKAVYPLDYNYFSESDFGMMLIELVAYMGHILSYKADYLANESFLPTARSRASVKKLLELIGIRMRGPISAAADAKLTLDSNPGWGVNSYLKIPAANRVITISSPEDGDPITYTIYKVASDGDVDLSDGTGDITIYNSEKASVLTVSSLVILEGSLVVETGTFSDTESLKSVTLQKSPVVEGSIQAFVFGQNQTSGQYREVENLFYASSGDDKIFQSLSDDNRSITVVFGDNNLGKVPSNGDTYTVIYRVGGGTRGNISKSLINAELPCQFYSNSSASGVDVNATIENTSKATGGANSESVEHAKKYGPLRFRSQDRLVTLHDYKAFVNSFITSYGSIGKATAVTRRAFSSANTIDIYVLERSDDIQLRKATPEYKRQIIQAIDDKKMLTDDVVIVDGLIRTLDLILSVRIDKKYESIENTIKNKARLKILEYFNIDNMEFGKEFNPQQLLYKLFEVDEIRFATVDNAPEIIKVQFNEIIQLNNFTLNIVYV